MRSTWWFFVFIVLTLPAMSETSGESDRHPILVSSADVVAAHFADGQDWTTEFVFVNLSDKQQSSDLYFLDSFGRVQTVQMKGLGSNYVFSFTLPPFGSLRMETLGGRRPLTQGFAVMEPKNPVENRIGATAIYRRELLGLPLREATAPFGNYFDKKAYVPFDHRFGFSSGVAFVNLSQEHDMTLLVDIYDETGVLRFYTTIHLPPYNHRAFDLVTNYPELIGRAGMAVISVQQTKETTAGFQLVAFRFSPTGSFTTITPMLSLQESVELLSP